MQLVGTRPKINKFFFNLEIQEGFENTIKKLALDDKEITDQTYF